MKNLLYLILLLPFCSVAQSRMSNPSGAVISICPGTTITQLTGETEVFRDTIKANAFIPSRYYNFMIVGSLTTPLLNFPTLTVKVKYGAQTYTLTNAALTIGNVTNGLFTIEGSIIAKTASTQFAFAKILQPTGSILSLQSSTYTPTYNFTNDNTTTLPVVITIQLTGSGTTSLTIGWVQRDAF